MADNWPCSTCPVRDAGFCGALLGQHSQAARIVTPPDWQDFRGARPNEVVLVRQEASEYVYVLCEGWAFRLLQLSDGRRQTLRYLLAGDLFSAVSFFVEKLNSSVQALTQIRLARFRRAEVNKRLADNAALSQALAASCVAEDAGSGELLLALGRRSAEERIAYLFMHLTKRIASRNVIREQRYPFPLLQQHIAEITGLTPVHVSRVLGHLRELGICRLSGGILEVLNLAELERMGAIR
jgi:CRP-like cAMP-binding protein